MNKRTKALRQGQTVWRVMAFIDGNKGSGFIEEFRVMEMPKPSQFLRTSLFLPVLWSSGIASQFSLTDAGYSEPNHYNNHRMFTSRRRAIRYLKQIESGCFSPNAVRSRSFHDDDYEGIIFEGDY